MKCKNYIKKGTIRNLQKHIAYKIEKRGFKDETIHERLLLLVEEVGELVNACRKITGMNCDVNRKIEVNVGEEVIDVINMVFAVGIELGLDIEKEFFKKEEIIEKRFYSRSKKNQLK